MQSSRLSRASSSEDKTLFDDQMKQLQLNHQQQLDQLKAHNERLLQEKQGNYASVFTALN